ncbi:MAG: hypothetical protein CSA65_01865 [Proteobacteria bacterium]|nr:MAG: hypothetical protein CSA65_01865 [Pseudomonadota bacterium]
MKKDSISDLTSTPGRSGLAVGVIASIDESHHPHVTFDQVGPYLAQVASRVAQRLGLLRNAAGTPVVLAFPEGDETRPVIIDLVVETLPVVGHHARSRSTDAADEGNQEGEADVRTVIEGQVALELRCGKAHVILHEDGEVVIRGTRIDSRARGTHRIRGGQVRVN